MSGGASGRYIVSARSMGRARLYRSRTVSVRRRTVCRTMLRRTSRRIQSGHGDGLAVAAGTAPAAVPSDEERGNTASPESCASIASFPTYTATSTTSASNRLATCSKKAMSSTGP